MKKIVPFKKDMLFNSNVSEITSISLEHDLNVCDSNTISGNFIINGEYKMSDSSINTQSFNFVLPCSINLDDRYILDNVSIDIDDFYYEIENDENLICYIDVLVEGVEEIEIEEIESIDPIPEITITPQPEIKPNEVLSRECDGDLYQNAQEEQNINLLTKEEIVNEEIVEENKQNKITEELLEKEPENMSETKQVNSLFSSLRDDDDTFATYSIYILRQDETLQTIIEKYKTTKEELEDYNDLTNITIGSKIIVPLHDK